MSARAVMVLGCTSGAGKSWLATALCRVYARRGYRVAPFKAQNMSNHARVVRVDSAGYGEIGSAQYFQALAAGVVPDVRMNPVLLKPESDTRSQVVMLGRVRGDLASIPWRERAPLLWRAAREAYESLHAEYELLIIEGAGSPAEINLVQTDYANTRTALLSSAACLLLADIDRGGAFAHLLGTYELMDAGVRMQLRGFVLNRFRGDASLLAPAPELLLRRTGVRTVAVIPLMRDHGLPEEDAVPADSTNDSGPLLVVIAGPHASNLDEFEPLRSAKVRLVFARDIATIKVADWLILPGTKQARADLAWLKAQGLATLIESHVRERRPMLALCGGLQILGELIEDPDGVEGGPPGTEPGLGLLPCVTRYQANKHLRPVAARFGSLNGAWECLSGHEVEGYEIHRGETGVRSGAEDRCQSVLGSGHPPRTLGWQCGSVLALYLHGLFENSSVLDALTGIRSSAPGIDFDALADHVEQSFTPGFLDSLIEPPSRPTAARESNQPTLTPLIPRRLCMVDAAAADYASEIPSWRHYVVPPLDEGARDAALRRLDTLTKPLGALGHLETLAAQLCAIQGRAIPLINVPHILVFAGDHGAADRGVSAYPRAVTAQMVANFVSGGAAINVLSRMHGLEMSIVDAGVDAELSPHPTLIAAKLRRGTRDYVVEPAMSSAECDDALSRAGKLVDQIASGGSTVLILGEMGIGNTASAALLMHGLTGRTLDLCIGRGTGLDDAGVRRKLGVLTAARARAPNTSDPIALLTQFGGYEIAMLVGAMLAGAAARMTLLVDGFTVTVAAALAARMEPRVLPYCVFGHRSAEQAHGALLEILNVEPLLDLKLRLGEGTGAVLALPLLRSAAALFSDMATFAAAGVNEQSPR